MLTKINEKYPGIRKRMLSIFLIDCNPNLISFIGIIMAFLSGYFFYSGYFLLASLLVILNGFFDILDGEIAKKFGREGKIGDFLDHTFDRIADLVIFMGIAFNPLVPLWLGSLTAVMVLMVSYMGTQYQAITGERLYGGFLGRSDRLVFIFVIGIVSIFFKEFLLYGLILILLLSLITFFQRFYLSYKGIK